MLNQQNDDVDSDQEAAVLQQEQFIKSPDVRTRQPSTVFDKSGSLKLKGRRIVRHSSESDSNQSQEDNQVEIVDDNMEQQLDVRSDPEMANQSLAQDKLEIDMPVSPDRVVVVNPANEYTDKNSYVTDPDNAGSPTGARSTFGALNRIVNTTPDPNMRNNQIPKNMIEDLHSLGEGRQEFTYMAKSGNRRVTFTTPKSASVIENYDSPDVKIVANTIDEPIEKEEQTFGSQTKKAVGILGCLGLIIGLTLIFIFMANASKEESTSQVMAANRIQDWPGKNGELINNPDKRPVDQNKDNQVQQITTAGLWSDEPLETENSKNVKSVQEKAKESQSSFYCDLDLQIFVSVDKPMYKGSDIIFVQAYLGQKSSNKLLLEDDKQGSVKLAAQVRVLNTKDEQVFISNPARPEDGSYAFAVKVPQNVVGGEYRVEVVPFAGSHFFPFSRKIRVIDNQQPNLQLQVDNDKNSYLPGDQINVQLTVKRADGSKLLAGSSFTIKYTHNNQQFQPITKQALPKNGLAQFNLRIPDVKESFSYSISIYEGYQESASMISAQTVKVVSKQNIQVLMNYLNQVTFKDLHQEVYFQVFAQRGDSYEAVDFEKAKLLKDGVSVMEMSEVHMGKAKFSYLAEMADYELHITVGGQLVKQKVRPTVDKGGFNVKIEDGGIFDNSQLTVTLQTNKAFTRTSIAVLLQNKMTRVVRRLIDMADGKQEKQIVLDVDIDRVGGVLILNAEDKAGYQKYERIVFQKPKLNFDKAALEIKTDQEEYTPGDSVEMSIEIDSSQLNGFEEENLFGTVTVTDVTGFQKVPNHKLDPSLPTMVFLEREVRPIAMPRQDKDLYQFDYSSEYLDHIFDIDSTQQQSYANLDVLLGIQSWRQYAYTKYRYQGFSLNEQKFMGASVARVCAPQPVQGGGINEIQGEVQNDDEEIFFDGPQPAPRPAGGGDAAREKDSEIANSGSSTQENSQEQLIDQAFLFEQRDTNQDFMGLAQSLNFRNYMHKKREGFDAAQPVRIDFTETIAFIASQRLESNADKFTLKVPSFDVSEQVTQFQISLNIYSDKGRYGFAKKLIKSSIPVYSTFTVPSNVIMGDKLSIPLTVYNNRAKDINLEYFILSSQVTSAGVNPLSQKASAVEIKANNAVQLLHELDSSKATNFKGSDDVRIYIQISLRLDGKVQDTLIKPIQVVKTGFVQFVTNAGLIGITKDMLSADDKIRTQEWQVYIPNDVEQFEEVSLRVQKSSIDKITEALKALARVPTGCFEQTASTVAPQVNGYRVLKELINTQTGDEKLNSQALLETFKENIKSGYKRMTTYEVETGGYEWFGRGEGHETLTAYGLQIFADIQQVDQSIVNPQTQQRVSDWLKNRKNRQADKLYQLNKKSLDTFGRSQQLVSDAYIVSTLAKLDGSGDFNEELGYLAQIGQNSQDPYILALYAMSLNYTGNLDEAKVVAKKLASMQEQDGSLVSPGSSITNSRGKNLVIETTALTAIAWLAIEPEAYQVQVQQAVEYISKAMTSYGRYGSTQATILSLTLLEKFIQATGANNPLVGQLVLFLDGNQIAQKDLSEQTDSPVIDLSYELESSLAKKYGVDLGGSSPVIKMEVKNGPSDYGFKLGYSFYGNYWDFKPALQNSDSISLGLKRQPENLESIPTPGDQMKVGITLENTSDMPQGMSIVNLPVPSCMNINFDQLEQLKDTGSVDNFEVSPDNSRIFFYVTQMKSKESKQFEVTLTRMFESTVCQTQKTLAYYYYYEEKRVVVQ